MLQWIHSKFVLSGWRGTSRLAFSLVSFDKTSTNPNAIRYTIAKITLCMNYIHDREGGVCAQDNLLFFLILIGFLKRVVVVYTQTESFTINNKVPIRLTIDTLNHKLTSPHFIHKYDVGRRRWQVLLDLTPLQKVRDRLFCWHWQLDLWPIGKVDNDRSTVGNTVADHWLQLNSLIIIRDKITG